MRNYSKKLLNIDVKDLPFQNFLTSRYSMTVRVNAKPTYNLAKKEDVSFFNLTLAAMLEGINEIPEFKRRILNGQVFEYEKINAVTPIIQKDHTIQEIEVLPPSEFDDIYKWCGYVENKKNNSENNQYEVNPDLRDSEPIANFSCIPWIDFDSMTNIIASAHQIMPVITWGKLVDGKISVSLSTSHIFIFGYHFKLFYENIEKYLKNPELL